MVLLLFGRLALLTMLVLPLAYLTRVGYLLVQVREDEVEHLAVPFHRVSFYAFFDVLIFSVLVNFIKCGTCVTGETYLRELKPVR